MIRQATAADLPLMESCALEFYRASRFLRNFDIEHFRHSWEMLLSNGSGVIFLYLDHDEIRGALGGVAYPDVNSGELTAVEFFWFISPSARGGGLKLYRAFEEWAREKQCRVIRMAHLADSMPEKMERVYQHLGFEVSEVHWTKELK